MTLANLHLRHDRSVSLMALRGDDGWLYLAVAGDVGDDVRVHAVSHTPVATRDAALETGIAYGRWSPADEMACYDFDDEDRG